MLSGLMCVTFDSLRRQCKSIIRRVYNKYGDGFERDVRKKNKNYDFTLHLKYGNHILSYIGNASLIYF